MIKKKSRIKRIFYRIIISIAVVILAIFLSFKFSPWPSALLMRYVFDKEANKTNQMLEKYAPKGVSEILDIQYDTADKDAKLDIYYPADINKDLPVIVWVHGGGWLSGNKGQTGNYFKILAAHGYVVVSIDYSIAPEKKYPTPVKQTMAALKFLQDNSSKFHIDSSSVFLGGDSAGAQIVAQVANILSAPNYAELVQITPSIERSKIKGLILYCGAYDAKNLDIHGAFGQSLNAMLWAYSGKKDFVNDAYFQTASITDYVENSFPPCFISAGNADPLLIQSQKLARKLTALNVKADTLFFPKDFTPELRHEYQFYLDVDAGNIALDRSLEFLKANQ